MDFVLPLVPRITNGTCSMQIYFQNRYDQPCSAQILIRASSGLFSGRAELSDITLGLKCDPAEFGCSIIPWTIAESLQGKLVSLSLYAGVKYPNGRGSLLRFKDGMRCWVCWNRFLAGGSSNSRRYWRRTCYFTSSTNQIHFFRLAFHRPNRKQFQQKQKQYGNSGDPIPQAIL